MKIKKSNFKFPTKAQVVGFFKANKWQFVQMAVVVGAVTLTADTSFAENVEGTQKVSKLGGTLEKVTANLNDAMTGDLPKVGVTVAAAGAFMNYAIGNESQVTKMATRVAIGGGAALSVPSLVTTVSGSCIG